MRVAQLPSIAAAGRVLAAVALAAACRSTVTVSSDGDAARSWPRGCQSIAIETRGFLADTWDPGRAASELARRCAAAEPRACGLLGELRLDGCGVAADAARAAIDLGRACDGAVAAACRSLAVLVDHGRGVREDGARALALFERGCGLGDRESCTTAGFAWAFGSRSNRPDPARARPLLERACHLGDAEACRLRGSGAATTRAARGPAAR